MTYFKETNADSLIKRPIFLVIKSQLFLLFNFSKFLYIFRLFIHPSTLNITNKTPHSPDDGSACRLNLLLYKFPLSIWITCCQFFFPNCRITIHYFLPYIYIYIYIYFIKHNRHFLSTYFLLDPFVFSYCFYRIRRELIYVLSIVVCIPSTFCPTLGHHQGRIYYKSSDTKVTSLL